MNCLRGQRAAVYLWLLLGLLWTTSAAAAQPNIVLVFIDDMGWADFSSFGNTDAATSHIDRLAAEGIAFEHFYVNSPICSPSRVAITTGHYPQRWGITSHISHKRLNEERGMAQWLDPAAPTLARGLKNAGYATGHFGKWHMGGTDDQSDAPPITEYGFDASLTNFEGIGPKLLHEMIYPDEDGNEARYRFVESAETQLGGPVTWMDRSQITSGYVDAALEFVDAARSDNKPFYINLWPDDVHDPFIPPIDQWRDSDRERFLVVLQEMDRQLAPLFDRIREDPALRGNTLIIICSDNGHVPGGGSGGPFKGYKTMLYEGGIRSPLIVWAPGLMDNAVTGSRNKSSVLAAIDLVPSLLALADAKRPPGPRYDGEDVLGTLLGKSSDSRQAPLFFARPPDRKAFYGFEDLPDLAVRSGNWKLLCDYDGGRPRLYDIVADPGESRNIADAHPDVTASLVRHVTTWYRALPEKS
ncbi:MAG: sulfatase-like hydrolase/transferase [Pseudomonadota bacterium]